MVLFNYFINQNGVFIKFSTNFDLLTSFDSFKIKGTILPLQNLVFLMF